MKKETVILQFYLFLINFMLFQFQGMLLQYIAYKSWPKSHINSLVALLQFWPHYYAFYIQGVYVYDTYMYT